MMNCRIITGAGVKAGLGHYKRMSELSRHLKTHGLVCGLTVLDDSCYNLSKGAVRLSARGQKLIHGIVAKEKNDIIIKDLRDSDCGLIYLLKKGGAFIAVIDDLGPGAPVADIRINSLVYPGGVYGKMPRRGLYSGSKYALLRDEFLRIGPARRKKTGSLTVSMGGSDKADLAGRLAGIISGADLNFKRINVIAGSAYRVSGALERTAASDGRVRVIGAPRGMAGILKRSDLLITGQGMTAYEAMYLGVPFIIAPGDPYHLELARKTHPAPSLIFDIFTEAPEKLIKKILRLQEDHAYGAAVAAAGRKRVDGRGAERTAALIVRKFYEKRGIL